MDELEKEFYAIAAAEVASKQVSPGLMAKAFVDAEGDETKAVVYYMKYRVRELHEEHQKRLERPARMKAELWTVCKECGYQGSMNRSFLPGSDHVLWARAVECPKCRYRFDWYYVPESDGA